MGTSNLWLHYLRLPALLTESTFNFSIGISKKICNLGYKLIKTFIKRGVLFSRNIANEKNKEAKRKSIKKIKKTRRNSFQLAFLKLKFFI